MAADAGRLRHSFSIAFGPERLHFALGQSMRVTPRQKRIATAALAVGALILVAGEIAARRSPAGCFRSYRLLPHHPSDALHFTNGIVRWFACGATEEGTYHRSSEGNWTWDWRNKRVTNTFMLRPHLLWLTVVDPSEPTNTYRLPRALSVPEEDKAHE